MNIIGILIIIPVKTLENPRYKLDMCSFHPQVMKPFRCWEMLLPSRPRRVAQPMGKMAGLAVGQGKIFQYP